MYEPSACASRTSYTHTITQTQIYIQLSPHSIHPCSLHVSIHIPYHFLGSRCVHALNGRTHTVYISSCGLLDVLQPTLIRPSHHINGSCTNLLLSCLVLFIDLIDNRRPVTNEFPYGIISSES